MLHADSSGSDLRMSPKPKLQHPIAMSRTNSSPGNFESSIDPPMRLAEIYVAAEHALKNTISDPDLWKSLSSLEEFEVVTLPDYIYEDLLSKV